MTGPPLVAVVGPTGTGKSDLALCLAERLGGEVVNADAMQLYRGLDVGTAKLPPDARRGVPHHQIDVLDVTETASVAAYQRHARADVEALRAAGRTPVLVGGSGLYVQAVLDELEFPGTDPDLRAALEAELADVGPHALHRRLAERDPAAAADVLPSNGRRIVRALEVIELTGRPFRARMPGTATPRYDAVLLGLDRDVAELDSLLAARVDRMLDDGLVAETAGLLPRGLRDGRTASRALGYRQVLDAFDQADSGGALGGSGRPGSAPTGSAAGGPGTAGGAAAVPGRTGATGGLGPAGGLAVPGPTGAAGGPGPTGATAVPGPTGATAVPGPAGGGTAPSLDAEALERVRAETVRATRRFVRRQRSWFRRNRAVHWLDGADPDLPSRALELVRTHTSAR